ncbi:MAG: peptidoglycan DD-metalloendopeptidase family protein [Nitriliruptorales bacterium]|nr:peptidoglycan DD-metalloendopeptidase family protein [Nitriliruptorales bacterium]
MALLVALPLMGSATLTSRDPAYAAENLAEKAAELAEVRERIQATSEQVAAGSAVLADVEADIATILQAVNTAGEAVERRQQAVDDAEDQLEAAQQEVDAELKIARGRAVELFKHGSGVPLASMLTAEDINDALNRSAYVSVVSLSDRRAIEQVEAALARVDAQRQRVQEEQDSLQRVVEHERTILAEAEALRNEQGLVLAASKEQLQELQTQEQHLEADTRQLAALARRSGAGAAVSGPGPSAGGWMFPATGPITSEFGRRWGRMHQGIDIGAPTGTPIYAAQPGCVTFAGRQGGYGNLILLDHGGGIVTAYAHQSRFRVSAGECVQAGQQIGEVGSTGNSTGPHLHFEVRVNGSARNPRNYL